MYVFFSKILGIAFNEIFKRKQHVIQHISKYIA